MTSPCGWSTVLAMLLTAAGVGGCGGATQSEADASADGAEYGLWSPEGGAPPSHAWNRLTPHAGRVLASARLGTIYVDADGKPAGVDAEIATIFGDAYWSVLQQYGVGPGAVVGNRRIEASSFFAPGAVQDGLVAESDVSASVRAALHPDGAATSFPEAANAYVVVLPPGVNVVLDDRGTHTYQTCVDVGGYHDFDGDEPYAVVPDCASGAASVTLSHELAELGTNPVPGLGWFSDDDLGHGGEVADLCQERPPLAEDGQALAELWSNAEGECLPRYP